MQKSKRASSPVKKKAPMKKTRASASSMLVPSVPSSALLRSLPDYPPLIRESESPRILMVLDQFNIGGTETYTLSLIRELLRQGVSVSVAGKPGKFRDAFLGLGCPLYELDFVTDSHHPNIPKADELTQLLKSILVTERIHIVHAHQYPSGKIAVKAAAQAGVPILFTIHGSYYDASFFQELDSTSTLVSVSPAVERMLLRYGLSSSLIPNGIDLEEFHELDPAYREHERNRIGIPAGATVLMYAGRLSWEKGDLCGELIRAVSALRSAGLPQLHLLIAGAGNKLKDLLELAQFQQQLAGHPFIHFAGETVSLAKYYAVSDAVIGTGRVGLEAMACGKPLIALGSRGLIGTVQSSRLPEVWDTWFGDHAAHRPYSQEFLKNQIKKVLTLDNRKTKELTESGREIVERRFNIRHTAKRLLELYKSRMSTAAAAKETRTFFH